MRKFILLISLFLVFENLSAQKIGLIYNTNDTVAAVCMKSILYKIENEYKTDFDVIKYCSESLQTDFKAIQTYNIRPTAFIAMKGQIKNICQQENLDFAIGLVQSIMGSDMAYNKMRYNTRDKSFGIVGHNINKKAFYTFFNVQAILYSSKSDKFIPVKLATEINHFEWNKFPEAILEEGRFKDEAIQKGISQIKANMDTILDSMKAAIKSND